MTWRRRAVGRVLGVLFVLAACAPSPEERADEQAGYRKHWDAVCAATPETWAKCKAVCGEGAAMLPGGENACVRCSCLPTGVRLEVTR
jgi:hypothetical protein